jgi:hypothetical protein
MASTSLIPDTPAGSQVRWYLETLATAGRNTSAADLERFSASASIRTPFPGQGEDLIEGWRRASAAIGPFTPTAIEQNGDFSITVRADGVNNTRRFSFRCDVEDHAPHLIKMLEYQRLLDVDVTVREASEADAAALSDLERRCPIVMGDTSMTIDRGTDYFAFTRLMEEAIVSIALVGGKVAGVNCGCYHDIRVGGKVYRTLTALHLRIDPQYQKKGLWGAVSSLFRQKHPEVVHSNAYISVENKAMQAGIANAPNKWTVNATRLQLSCASSLAGPSYGRHATQADAPRIVEILNACHGSEEMYVPYSVESFTARVERAPEFYSWDRLLMTDHAVVGVWPAGEKITFVTDSKTGRVESRRGLVVDYGFITGAERDLESLLRAWCAQLKEQGLDTLTIFTSDASPGSGLLSSLADASESYVVWTPGIAEPPSAAIYGIYVDSIYF